MYKLLALIAKNNLRYIYIMDKLEFENFEVNLASDQNDQGEVDGVRTSEEQAIQFSSSVIIALEQKAKEHNQEHKSKVTVQQLKKVYRTGALTSEKEKGLHALARVNMFLRMKREGKVVYQQASAMNEQIEIKELTFQNKVKVDSFVDLTQGLVPIDDDFIRASKDEESFGLTYKFQDVSELYLDDYEKLDIIWG